MDVLDECRDCSGLDGGVVDVLRYFEVVPDFEVVEKPLTYSLSSWTGMGMRSS